MTTTALITIFLVLVVYYVIHVMDRVRGTHVTLIEEKLADGSWTTRELVRRGDHLRLMSLVWSSKWTRVKRLRILCTCSGELSVREAREYFSDTMGVELRHSHETFSEYVKYTKRFFGNK